MKKKTNKRKASESRTFAIEPIPNSPQVRLNLGNGRTVKMPLSVQAADPLTIPAFYSGVRFISETLSCLPIRVNRKLPNGNVVRNVGHYLEVLISEQPNDLVNAIYLWETTVAHAVMYGNGYVWIERSGGKVVALHNMHALCVVPFRFEGRQKYALRATDGSALRNEDGQAVVIDSADMIHVRNFSENGEDGISVLDTLAKTLGIAKSIDDFLATYWENGSAVNLVVEAEKGLKEDDVDTLRYSVEENHKGMQNAHKVMVLVGATAKNLTLPLKDFAYEILKPATVDDIARVLRIPPHTLYQLADSNYNTTEALGTDLGKFGFNSWVRKIELEKKRKLFTSSEVSDGYYVQWDLNGLMRGDFKNRRDTLRADYLAGLISWESYQELEDQPTERNGTYITPLNMRATTYKDGEIVAVQDATTAPELATTPTEPTTELQPQEDAVTDGSATPIPAEPQTPPAATENASASFGKPSVLETYGRVLDRIGERVRTKNKKAFANHASWDGDKRAEWVKKFAQEQGLTLGEELNPVLESVIADKTDLAFALQAVVEDYEALVLREGQDADPTEVINKAISRVK